MVRGFGENSSEACCSKTKEPRTRSSWSVAPPTHKSVPFALPAEYPNYVRLARTQLWNVATVNHRQKNHIRGVCQGSQRQIGCHLAQCWYFQKRGRQAQFAQVDENGWKAFRIKLDSSSNQEEIIMTKGNSVGIDGFRLDEV